MEDVLPVDVAYLVVCMYTLTINIKYCSQHVCTTWLYAETRPHHLDG